MSGHLTRLPITPLITRRCLSMLRRLQERRNIIAALLPSHVLRMGEGHGMPSCPNMLGKTSGRRNWRGKRTSCILESGRGIAHSPSSPSLCSIGLLISLCRDVPSMSRTKFQMNKPGSCIYSMGSNPLIQRFFFCNYCDQIG